VTLNGSGVLSLAASTTPWARFASASATSAISPLGRRHAHRPGGNNTSTTFAGVISGGGTGGF
jgi:hypothetical protein